MKNQLPFCPYCKQRISYLQAWGIHKDGEYQCPRCNRASNIKYTKRIRTFAAVACVIGFLISILLAIFRESIQFGHMALIIIPFLFFFLLAPFTIVLSPMKTHGKRPMKRGKPTGSFQKERHRSPMEREFVKKQDSFGDTMSVSPVSHSDYYSSKYDFSLFEETRQMDKVKNNPSAPKRKPAARPVKRRVDPPKAAKGPEEEIDQILQDFIDE